MGDGQVHLKSHRISRLIGNFDRIRNSLDEPRDNAQDGDLQGTGRENPEPRKHLRLRLSNPFVILNDISIAECTHSGDGTCDTCNCVRIETEFLNDRSRAISQTI